MQSIICFVSDFGLDDTWVGVCHAVIHKACPQARVVDLGHHVPPFDVRKGAVVAASGVHQLPEAIHLVVVDPGVGGRRANLCLVTAGGTRLVGPDNGVLIPACERTGGVAEAYAIDPSVISATPPLPTFHARDVMAPAAAALACGVEPSRLGEPLKVSDLVPAPFGPATARGGILEAEVLDIDRYGSARIAVTEQDLAGLGATEQGLLDISIGHVKIHAPWRGTFSDVGEGEPVLMIDSSGWLTLSLRLDDASDRYGIEQGDSVRVAVG